MKPKSALRSFLLAGSSVIAISSASAQSTLTWDITPGTIGAGNGTITGGTGAWNTTNGNWTSDAGANNIAWDNSTPSLNTAIFGAVAGVSTVALGEAINIKTLTINSVTSANRYTIQGSALNFSSGGSITWNSTNATNFADVSSIISAITGAPTVTGAGTSGNTQFVFAPSSGSQTLGKLGGVAVYRLAGSTTGNSFTGTVSPSNNDTKIFVSSGASWTLTGVASGYEHQIAGTLIIGPGGTLRNGARDTALTSTGILHWNSAGAIQDGVISAQRDRDFRIDGGSIDNTSGEAITTSTHNPQMRWNGNWTFIGSNGANSNLNIGTGNVFLNSATRQVTVTNAATTLTVGGLIANDATSGRGLTKAGAGTLELRGASTYNGATSVNAGTLAITGTGSINSSSGISVAAGGTFRYNSSTALTKAPTLAGAGISNRAVLGGTGPINVAVTLDNLGDILAPGNSPGIQNYTVGQSWTSFSYDWEVNNFTGTTAGTDFDQIGIAGTLDLTGGSGSYILNVLGLTALNAPGLVPNFSEIDRSWTILTSTGLTGFNSANWTINTAGFTDPDAGTWALAPSGDNLVLSYTAVPEPRAALLGALGLLMLLRRRR